MKAPSITVLAILIAALFADLPMRQLLAGQSQQPSQQSQQSSQSGSDSKQRRKTQQGREYDLETRDLIRNGIGVGEPKVYDDAALQQMLYAAEARLATLHVIDQTGITSKLGSITGATVTTSGFGLNVQGPGLPQVVTTSKGATGSTIETDKTLVAADGKTSTDTTLQTTSGLASQDVQTTRAAATAPSVTAPAATTGMPSSFSVSASDILNEQMQLTYEIANLRLLLEGSLSDQYLRSEEVEMSKPRTTLGFPITISPDVRHKNAVAIVEVEVEKMQDLGSGEPPAITALLPRDKTYNVAAITDRSTSIGGGMITQIVGVSFSWLRGRKTYYLVQEQDTVALTLPPYGKERVSFMWQFRPVLGQQYVKAGLKQTFVQVVIPSSWSAKCFGRVRIRTYWRRYDSKKGVLKEILPYSLMENVIDWKIPRINLVLKPRAFNVKSLEDLGNGLMLVKLDGRYLRGTYIRIGSTTLREGTPGITFEHYGIKFVAPISELATKNVAIVARDGTEQPLEIPKIALPKPEKNSLPTGADPEGGTVKASTDECAPSLKKPPATEAAPVIQSVAVSTVDEANSLVTLKMDKSYVNTKPQLVMIIGGRVFGYSDAPVTWDDRCVTTTPTEAKTDDWCMSAVVPTSLLVANAKVTVKSLFAPEGYQAEKNVTYYTPTSRTERLVVMEQGDGFTKFILFGNRLTEAQVLRPEGVELEPLTSRPDDLDTLRVIRLEEKQIKANKNLILQRKGERPILIQIPSLESKKPEPKLSETLTVNEDEAVVEIDGFKDLEKVVWKDNLLRFEVFGGGKFVKLKGLREKGVTSSAAIQSLDFIFKDAKATLKVEVNEK